MAAWRLSALWLLLSALASSCVLTVNPSQVQYLLLPGYSSMLKPCSVCGGAGDVLAKVG